VDAIGFAEAAIRRVGVRVLWKEDFGRESGVGWLLAWIVVGVAVMGWGRWGKSYALGTFLVRYVGDGQVCWGRPGCELAKAVNRWPAAMSCSCCVCLFSPTPTPSVSLSLPTPVTTVLLSLPHFKYYRKVCMPASERQTGHVSLSTLIID
jgi:hypothetical protein